MFTNIYNGQSVVASINDSVNIVYPQIREWFRILSHIFENNLLKMDQCLSQNPE